MNVIKIGPMLLDFELLKLLLSSMMGYMALKHRLRGEEEHGSDKYLNVLVITILIWKFSPILFDPLSVFSHPLSLLYFDGGTRGAGIAAVLALIYLGIRIRKEKTSLILNLDAITVGLIFGIGSYHLLSMLMGGQAFTYHVLQVLLVVGVGLFLYFKTKLAVVQVSILIRSLLWYSLGGMAIPFVQSDRDLWLWNFTLVQVLMLILFVLALGIDMVFSKQLERRN